MSKEMRYYLNGRRAKYQDIRKRKAKLTDTIIITEKWYEAPPTEEENKKEEEDRKNANEFFKKMREQREWRDKYHG